MLIGIHAIVAIHVAHWMSGGKTLSPLEPSESMEFCKRGLVNAGFIFFTTTILSTLVLGRFFCGWACHVVALQDLARGILKKMGITPRPLRSRILLVVPFLGFGYMFLWPLADRIFSTGSAAATRVNLSTESFWATFPSWPIALLTFLVCGFAIIYFLGSKGFCTYACPYGAIFGTVDRFAVGRIRVTDACQGCAHCTAVCTSNVRVHEEVALFGMVVDPGCMKCLDCVSVCPNDALYFGFGKPAILVKGKSRQKKRGEFGWREEVLLALFFGLAFFVLHGIDELYMSSLYDAFPLLYALGLSAILAYLCVQAVRLAYAPNVSLLRWPLKQSGRLVRGGVAFLALMGVVVVLGSHSGCIQWHATMRRRLYDRSAEIRPNLPALLQSPVTLDATQTALVDAGIRHADLVEKWGLLPDGNNEVARAWFHFLKGENAAAEKVLVRFLERNPKNAVWRLGYGLFLRSHGRLDEAIGVFREAIRVDPKFVDARLALAQTLAGAGRPADAARTFDEAVAAGLDTPNLLFEYGRFLISTGDVDGAIARFERVVQLAPTVVDAYLALSQLYASKGDRAASKRWYDEAVRIDPVRAAGKH
ncbi:MAG: tetratricopeptide repeat protein [Planctomycetes bacterium]|nr:tetratricopeptide repeat protein [Planctomycetota bacterium]